MDDNIKEKGVLKGRIVSALLLTLLFIGMLTLAFNIQPAKADPSIYYTFEIIDPHKVAFPGNTTYFRMQITNLCDWPLEWGSAMVLIGPSGYGYMLFNLEYPYPTVPPGETYEGPIFYIVLNTTVPIGFVVEGEAEIRMYVMGDEVVSPRVPFSVLIAAPAPPPPPVGGKATPINIPIIKPELQIPWIWLSTIILPLVATLVFVKLKKKR